MNLLKTAFAELKLMPWRVRAAAIFVGLLALSIVVLLHVALLSLGVPGIVVIGTIYAFGFFIRAMMALDEWERDGRYQAKLKQERTAVRAARTAVEEVARLARGEK
jgi:fatty acid desaturase